MKFVNAKESYNQSIQIYIEKIEFEQESMGHFLLTTVSRWHHVMDQLCAWVILYAVNAPATGGFPAEKDR